MKIIQSEFLLHKEEIVAGIHAGKLFIYPTDTIYGIGCDATNKKAIEKIRKLKHREKRPFLIVVPNLEWVWDNCEVSESARREMEGKLPGRFSFFLKLKNKKALAYKELHPLLDGEIGIRFLDHAFQAIVSAAGIPFVTTSVNVSGEPFAKSFADMQPAIRDQVDYVIDVGEIAGPPSQRINLAI